MARTTTGDGSAAGWLYIAPALVFLTLCFFVPVAVMTGVSLQPLHPGDWGPFANYERFFTQPAMLGALWNSLFLSAVVALTSVLVGYPLAAAIAFGVPERWQRLVLILLILPFWTSYVVRSYAWLLVLAPNGVVNETLLGLGLIAEPLRLNFSIAATVIGFVHFFAMLTAFVIYSGLRQIDRSVLLAAADLGAGRIMAWIRIVLPLSAPSVAVAAFLSFVMCIGDYITPQILGGNTAPVLPQAIMTQLNRSNDVPMAATLAFVLTTVVLVVVTICVPLYRARGRP